MVVTQAGDFTSWVADKATAEPPATKDTLGYSLPDEFGDNGKCAGSLKKDDDKRYQILGKYCELDNDVYVNSDTRVGNISLDQRILFGDGLSTTQIAAALDFEVNDRYDYTGEKRGGKFHWRCNQQRVRVQLNLMGVLHSCSRSIDALPGLHDYWFLFVESPSGPSGLISSAYFTGFKLQDTQRVLKLLMANTQREAQP